MLFAGSVQLPLAVSKVNSGTLLTIKVGGYATLLIKGNPTTLLL